jgi:23S rRNA pseudouridine1911/1915/1917 synthase
MAAEETLVIDASTAGARLDKVLAGLPSVGSREKARQVLKSGKVTLDGSAVGADDGGRALSAGNRIVVRWNQPGTGTRRVAAKEALDRAGVVVRYEDAAILVADKPAGLLTDAADADQLKNRDTLRKRVRAWLRGDQVWPAHRIDRDTTGLVVFAKTEVAQAALKAQWIERTPVRVYLAVLEGSIEGDRGRFSDWMRWDGPTRIQRPCEPDTEGAWLAQADWTVKQRFDGRGTLVEVRLITGRRNQIRLHAMLAGHPLYGEPLYKIPVRPGSRAAARAATRPTIERQALHAHQLGFVHPTTREPVSFESPIPEDIAELLRRLRRV